MRRKEMERILVELQRDILFVWGTAVAKKIAEGNYSGPQTLTVEVETQKLHSISMVHLEEKK